MIIAKNEKEILRQIRFFISSMKEKKLSYLQISETLGISSEYVRKIHKTKYMPKLERLLILAKKAGVSYLITNCNNVVIEGQRYE